MIYTTYADPEMRIRIGLRNTETGALMFREREAEVPWLREFQHKAHSKDRQQRALGERTATLGMFRRFNWEPQAVEKVLAWIETGDWSAVHKSKKAQLLMDTDIAKAIRETAIQRTSNGGAEVH